MRIKILLDNIWQQMELRSSIFFMIILPRFFEAYTNKSTIPPAFYGICNLGALSASDAVSRVNGSRDYSLTLDDLNLPAPPAR
jgi:hypothetical protein